MDNKIKYSFKLIGFRCVTPKETDKLMYVKNGFGKEISYYENHELYNKLLAEVLFNQRKMNNNGNWYYFYDGYSIDKDYKVKFDTIQYDSSILYSEGITTNVSCIVGKNGCGKTSIIEMIIKILNNFLFANCAQNYKIIADKAYLKYAENLFCDLVYEYCESFVVLSVRGRNLTYRESGWNKCDRRIQRCTITHTFTENDQNFVYYNDTKKIDKFSNLTSIFSMFFYKNSESQNNASKTELNHKQCVKTLLEIPDNDYDLPVKISLPETNPNKLLSHCFYFEMAKNGKCQYPLRYVNDDCSIIGFIIKNRNINWDVVNLLYKEASYSSLQKKKSLILKVLKGKYNICPDAVAPYREIEDIVLTATLNALASDFISQKKIYERESIVKEWIKTESFYLYELTNVEEIIKQRGSNNLLENDSDIYNKWLSFKTEKSTEWLNNNLIDFFIQKKIDGNFIIEQFVEDFCDYIQEINIKKISDNIVDKYMKIWELLSLKVDVFMQNYDINKKIEFDSFFSVKDAKKKDDVIVLFNGNELYTRDLCMSISDLIYPLQLLNIELILQAKDKTTRVFCGLSSGEKQLLNTRSRIIQHLINVDAHSKYKFINAVFDEVEMFLHPEWQRLFLSRIIKGITLVNFKNIKGINILIATHSPFILSDVPKANIAFIDDDGNMKEKQYMENTFGANIHELFNNSFYMKSTLGEIAVKHIKDIVTLYEEVKADIYDKQFGQLKVKIENNKALFDYVKNIIGDNYYNYTIKSILDYLYDKYNILSDEEIIHNIEVHKLALERLNRLRRK